MVQGGKGKKDGVVSYCQAHFLRPAADEGRADIHRPEADVPFRHRDDEDIRRFAEQKQVQGSKTVTDIGSRLLTAKNHKKTTA